MAALDPPHLDHLSRTPRPPDQVVVWSPAEVGRALDGLDEADPFPACASGSTCLGRTRAGDRAAIYETRDGRGIVALFDFGGPPMGQSSWGSMAPGVIRPLSAPVERAELLRDPLLAPTFRRLQGKRSLSHAAGRRLSELFGSPIPFASLDIEVAPGELHARPADPGRSYGTEAAMQAAIRSSRRCYRKLGYRLRPEAERRSRDGSQRYDLISRPLGILTELKLEGTLAVLAQVDGYLERLRSERPRDWIAHIVVASWASPTLQKAVAERGDILLWRCSRSALGPRLTEIRSDG